MRLLTAFCIAVLAVAIATPAFAAVQNIKVSGDISSRVIYSENMDLKDEALESTLPDAAGVAGGGAAINADDDTYILLTSKVRIDADLTDNVSAAVVLGDQTTWGDLQTAAFNNIQLHTAYVTLKEFFYSPLTLTIGRQPLLFGQGFVVGPGLLNDPEAVFTANVWGRQYSIYNNFDAVRATIDLDPWTIDGIYAKVNETNLVVDDEDLFGVNVGYKFDVYNAKLEGYWFYDRDESYNTALGIPAAGAADLGGVGTRTYEENEVHTLGLRGDIEPVDNLTLCGEVAFQLGNILDDTPGAAGWPGDTNGAPLERDREAIAANVEGNYTWKEVSYQPSLGLGYVFYEGEENANAGDYDAWDPMFKGKFFSAIRDYQAGDQTDGTWSNLYATLDADDTAGNTNSHILFVDGGLKPMEDLTLKARYLHFWFHERPVTGRNRTIGDEVDASLVYDYTEDVQFDLTGAWFIPGKYYDGQADDNARSNDIATAVSGSVRVAF